MSDDSSQEKTEEPTGKKLQDAKNKGQVPRSKDFNTTFILIVASIVFLSLGPYFGDEIMKVMKAAMSFKREVLVTPETTFNFVIALATRVLFVIGPFLFSLMVAALIAPIMIGGWSFSAESLLPKLSRMDVIKGIAKMFSVRSLVELTKALFKFIVILAVALAVLYKEFDALMSLGTFDVKIAIGKAITMLAWAFLLVSCGLIVISAVDVPYQIWEHIRQLKMSLQEVKDEYKESEGKPEVKGHIRRMQQEISQRRMMADVPKADVILTNPTHYSVALQYNQAGLGAPTVIAKGQDFVALQINKVGQGNAIPILQLPPLARAIYFSTEINHEIPQGLYTAVAQVLAYIFQLKRKKSDDYEKSPEFLNDLPIPDELFVPGEGDTQ